MFLTVTLFAAMMFFGGFILPESPRWLMLKRRKEQAIAVLMLIGRYVTHALMVNALELQPPVASPLART